MPVLSEMSVVVAVLDFDIGGAVLLAILNSSCDKVVAEVVAWLWKSVETDCEPKWPNMLLIGYTSN